MPGENCARVAALLLLCLSVFTPPAAASPDAAAAQPHLRTAGQAYRDGDYAGYTAALETAVALNPFSLPTRYNLACGYARTGQPDKALAILRELTAARVDFGMAADDDLAALRDEPEFQALVAQSESAIVPVAASKPRFRLDQLGLVPEGIAHDPASDRLFFGSMRSGDIYVLDAGDQLSKFATVEHEGSMAAIGLTVDNARGLLWAVGSTFGLVEGFDPEAPARSGVFAFDLATGEPRDRFLAAAPVNGYNDVALGPAGEIYVSGDALSVVAPGSDEIVALDTSIPIFGSNGIAVRPDGKRLFVSSYPVGIAAVDPATGDAAWLEMPGDVTLYGIDGLYWHEGDLVGVQNGTRPWRLVRLELDAAQAAVTNVRFIEFANPDITATTGAIDGDRIHFVGQGPDPVDVPGHFPPALAQFAGPVVIMTAPLD